MNNERTKIMLLCPYPKSVEEGAGGIRSWSRVFVATFPNEEFDLYPINIAPNVFFGHMKKWERPIQGLKTTLRILREAKKLLEEHPDIRIMHTTTSGDLGSLRDYLAVRLCHRHGVRCIMHCRFGTIKEFYEAKGLFSMIFKKNLRLFDQTWVLDRRSESFLKDQFRLKDKIFLTPNSISVPNVQLRPKSYRRVGFVGNLLSTKGIIELAKAVYTLPSDTLLFIAGTGPKDIVAQIKDIAGEKLDKQIMMIGSLPNEKALELMDSLDILALPTYYPGEAFPISILEAMSLGKLVVSCPRAAIPDMLTAIDGTPCGILVPERDVNALKEAILWSQEHPFDADEICKKAYEKVKKAYCKEVVYEIYRQNYRLLLH